MRQHAIAALLLWLVVASAWGADFLTTQDFHSSRFSGFNLYDAAAIKEKDMVDLKGTGARLARYNIKIKRCAYCDYYPFPTKEVQRFDQLVAWARIVDLRLILVLDPAPEREAAEFWQDPKLQDSIVRLWGFLAAAYKDNPTVAGYDIINEPVAPASLRASWEDKDPEQWPAFAQRIIGAIRAVDSRHLIFYEASPLAAAHTFKRLRPLADTNVVYTFHFYEPHRITHQGIFKFPHGVSYPGTALKAGYWDKKRLSEEMQPVREFSKKYRVPILLSEFSCIRWAPGDSRDQYLRDVLDLAAAENWPWLYHGFREWQGWDAELPSNDRDSNERSPNTPAIVLIKQRLAATK